MVETSEKYEKSKNDFSNIQKSLKEKCDKIITNKRVHCCFCGEPASQCLRTCSNITNKETFDPYFMCCDCFRQFSVMMNIYKAENCDNPKEDAVTKITLGEGKYILKYRADALSERLHVQVWESKIVFKTGEKIEPNVADKQMDKLVAEFNITKEYLEIMLNDIPKFITAITNYQVLAC